MTRCNARATPVQRRVVRGVQRPCNAGATLGRHSPLYPMALHPPLKAGQPPVKRPRSGPNARRLSGFRGGSGAGLPFRAVRGRGWLVNAPINTNWFLETLTIPDGLKAGQPVKLAPFQRQSGKVVLTDSVNVAVLSIGRRVTAGEGYQRTLCGHAPRSRQ